MFSGYTSGEYQSVVFFVDGHVDREMMFPEFEAVLDNFVPMPGYADMSVQAVCLGINGQLKIISAVFFLLGFDSAGNADRKWNIPLQQLADEAEPGPDLGAGPIRLCCRSQCPVEWHVQELWDPDMSRQPNDFVLLRDLAKRNKLGFKELPLEVDDIDEAAPRLSSAPQQVTGVTAGSLLLSADMELSDADKALAQSLIHYVRKKMTVDNSAQLEQMERQQQLLLAAQKNRFDDELKALEQIHSDEMRQLQQHARQMMEAIEHEKQVAENLRRQLAEQQQMAESMRDTFHQQLATSKQVEGDQIDVLKANYASELELRIQAIVAEHQQQLDMKDVETAYRHEQNEILKEEVAQLHAEHAQLIREAGEQFITRLRDNKVTFLAYHPGAGNVTIDLENIGTYLENPIAYAANICKVNEADYRAWLAHYANPVCCEHSTAKGDICNKKLRRVDTPTQFVSGRSDRCPLHWAFSGTATAGQNAPETTTH